MDCQGISKTEFSEIHSKNDCNLASSGANNFFIRTPMITKSMQTAAGVIMDVYFKLECLQPSGSFKDRGISHMITSFVNRGHVSRIICSSGVICPKIYDAF